MTPEEYFDEVICSDWYSCPDDEIGGYQIRTMPGPTSTNWGIEVASFLSPTVAEHVVRLHGEWLDRNDS
jgi:hypothetical protein